MRTVFSLLLFAATLLARANSDDVHQIKESTMMQEAHGPFDVKLAALEPYNATDPSMGRRSLDKRFHGDLDAVSRGEMLSVGTARDNGGYVAVERVVGSLHGRNGSFALMHNATMTRGVPALNIVVVPGSGTGELAGIAGRLHIDVTPEGAHSYRFEYAFDGP